ncbi:MAG: S41 family peptidase [Synergistetes bacterium]|nr:MAG: Carboxyl-terminal protease [bacterium 42_11]MBC7332800.1 S41 family peptidase [Synergistota bacterium]MDK2870787.1 carboxyl-terminal processing protease [bacterium]
MRLKNRVFLLAILSLLILNSVSFPQETPSTAPNVTTVPLPQNAVPTDLLGSIVQLWNILKNYYVDPDKIDPEKLKYGALKGLVEALGDPYTRYEDPQEYKEEQIQLEGKYGGLGIIITKKDDKIVIVSPIEDTPAYKLGLKADDEIVRIEDEPTQGMSLSKVVKLLRGEPGTKVTIWVRRPGKDKLLKFTITRAQINLKAVKSEMLENGIAYIRITYFNQNTTKELESALKSLSKKGFKGIILDLRNNPGGLLNEAVSVAKMFIDKGVIVSTKGRYPWHTVVYEADGTAIPYCPMVVLVNRGSASASEIVAGALQDHKRAKLVGVRTFGKGSVQTVIPFNDGSALHITIAYYYTPNGRLIHEKGLTPDIVVNQPEDSKKDVQLERAKDILLEEIKKS